MFLFVLKKVVIAACFYNNLHLFDIRHTYHVDFVDIFQVDKIHEQNINVCIAYKH